MARSGSAYAKVNAINNAGVSGLTATAANSHGADVRDGRQHGCRRPTYDLTIERHGDLQRREQRGHRRSRLTAADVAAQVNLYSSADWRVRERERHHR